MTSSMTTEAQVYEPNDIDSLVGSQGYFREDF